jgi:hypothetical protein
MENIPNGYDENGVRNGNSKWYDDEGGTGYEQGDFDDYDYFKEVDKGHFVECEYCGKLVDVKSAWDINYGTKYVCENCKSKINKLSSSMLWRTVKINLKK